MKKLLIPILLCACIFNSFSQNKMLDSLKRELQKHPLRDSMRVKLLVSISFYSYESPEDTKRFAEEALQLATELNYQKGRGGALSNMATYYWERSDHKKALELTFLALNAYEKAGSQKGIYQSYNAIAGLYIAIHDYDKGIDYLNKAMDMGKVNESVVDYGNLYHNLGVTHSYKKEFDKAQEYFARSLEIREKRNDIYGQGVVHHDLAQALYESGDSKGAIMHYEKALVFARQLYAPPVIASAQNNLAKIFIEQNEYSKAEAALKESQQILEQTQNKTTLQELYGTYSNLYEKQKDYRQALSYFRKKTALKDSLFNEQNIRQMAETESRYEAEKKEQEIALLEQKTKTAALWRNSLSAGLLLTVVAAAVIYGLQRSRTRKAKLLLETQQLLNIKMQEADKLKSRFFANISHEFRTPLTLILSPVEEKLLINDLSQKDKISFQSIKRSANRLLELINQLLELSKIESGFMKVRPQPGNLQNFIVPILSSFDSLADLNQTRYNKEIRIPSCTVSFDSDKLEKIFNNLLSNAFKFSPKAGRVDVKVVAAEKESSVEMTVEVKNSGPVIPKNMLDKIFEPFFQGPSASSHGIPGTGLGLPLVKELVKLHEGDIRVASTGGEGTVFTITLTFEKAQGVPETIPAGEKVTAITYTEDTFENNYATADASKETILIVEDNLDVRNLIRQGLETHYNILEATTGKEAAEITHAHAVDLVVSDVMMPMMNGIELCHLLKNDEITSHIPVILLTARADHESKLEGLRTGADDYLVKPFNLQELLARVGNLLTQRKKLIQKYEQRIIVQPHEITVTPLDERFIQRAIRIVEDNLDNAELSVDKMAEELGMSRTNLHRKLKAITGYSTSEFIQDFRLRRAAQLIEKKADTISQIAYQIGFNDQSYFTKCFKKKFGKTPSEFALAGE